MSKCIFSILLVLLAVSLKAQSTETDTIVPVKTERYGVRFGIDASKIARSFYEEDYRGLELVGDYRLTKSYYIAAELGNENKTIDGDRLNFTTKGSFLKVGFDYNVYENWLDMENLLYVGLRYGISTFSQELNSYRVYNPNPYFGESPTVISGETFEGLNAQWAEFVAGLKAEMFSNLYVGFSFRINRLFINNKPSDLDNFFIPGFNQKYSGNFGVGFNYTITYFIPIYKKKILPAEKVEK